MFSDIEDRYAKNIAVAKTLRGMDAAAVQAFHHGVVGAGRRNDRPLGSDCLLE